MADEPKGDVKAPETEPEEVVFSEAQQRKIDEIISGRVSEIRVKAAQERKEMEDRHRREMERSKMDEETRLKEESKEREESLVRRAEEAERKLRVATAERELAKAGLDPVLAETLMGADDDQMAKNIAAVVRAAQSRADQIYAERVGTPGAPRAPSQGEAEDVAHLREVMGLRPLRGGIAWQRHTALGTSAPTPCRAGSTTSSA